jgi:nucleoside-diphosphate-sugar epimerase
MILVTGGAGFVGSHFVRAACNAGLGVVVPDDLSGGAKLPLPLPESVCFVSGDIALVAEVQRQWAGAPAHRSVESISARYLANNTLISAGT